MTDSERVMLKYAVWLNKFILSPLGVTLGRGAINSFFLITDSFLDVPITSMISFLVSGMRKSLTFSLFSSFSSSFSFFAGGPSPLRSSSGFTPSLVSALMSLKPTTVVVLGLAWLILYSSGSPDSRLSTQMPPTCAKLQYFRLKNYTQNTKFS